MLSKKDFAGSGNKLCQAVSKYSDIYIRLITTELSKYNYDTDYLLNKTNRSFLQRLINNADIIHFKGDDLPEINWFGLKLTNVPVVVTVGGSGFRRNVDKSVGYSWFGFNKYIERSDLRTTLTPDLNYPDYNGQYIPQTIECEEKENSFQYRAIPVIAHSPSNRTKKGTGNIILPALEILKNKGYKFELDLIENVSNKECIERKRNANIFIDQISDTGFYGISALEAMQFGIITMAYVSELAINQSNEILNSSNLTVVNTGNSIDSLVKSLENILNLSEKQQIKLSEKTKKYCDVIHGEKEIANKWTSIYKTIYANNIDRINRAKETQPMTEIPKTDFVKIKIINNKFNGHVLDYQLYQIIEVDYMQAVQFIKKGIAEISNDEVSPVQKLAIDKKLNVVPNSGWANNISAINYRSKY